MTKGPESTKSAMWEFIVNNALRTADEYAVNHNSNAVFIGPNVKIYFIKQYDGEFKGRHLLEIINQYGDSTSFAMLLPLFDENASSESLSDEGKLWKIIIAKYNGREF